MQVVLDDLRGGQLSTRGSGLLRRGEPRVVRLIGLQRTSTGRRSPPRPGFGSGASRRSVTSALVLDAGGDGASSRSTTRSSRGYPVSSTMSRPSRSGCCWRTPAASSTPATRATWSATSARISDPVLRRQAQDLGVRYLAGESVIVPDRVWIALANTHPLYFEPGHGHHYSNVNYQLADDGTRGRDRQGPRVPARGPTGGPLRPVSRPPLLPPISRYRTCAGYTRDPATGRGRRHHHRSPRRRQRRQRRRHVDRRRAARPPAGDRRRRPAAGSAPRPR